MSYIPATYLILDSYSYLVVDGRQDVSKMCGRQPLRCRFCIKSRIHHDRDQCHRISIFQHTNCLPRIASDSSNDFHIHLWYDFHMSFLPLLLAINHSDLKYKNDDNFDRESFLTQSYQYFLANLAFLFTYSFHFHLFLSMP